MNKNVKKILIGAAILVVAILAGVIYQNYDADNTNELVNKASVEENNLSITTTIDNGDTQTSFDKKVSSDNTALDVFNLIIEEDGVVIGTTEYDFGIMIDSIDGVGEDVDDGKYWSFYVNDEMSMVGVSDYVVNDNDQILMKYQAL
ncbi:DUF4430 domain-containing protein [bacterium]|nr:DUF4430 domain-containing protein [bacterium]